MPLVHPSLWVNVHPSIILMPVAGLGFSGLKQLRQHRNSSTVGHLRLYRKRTHLDFFCRDDPSPSILRFSLMSFATTFITGWANFLFASCPSSCTNIFIIRVDRLRTGAWELLGHGLRGLEKVSAPCTITRCALEHFLVGHWLLQAHFCIEHIEEGWEWGRFPWLICWCRLRWQGYDILSSALVLFL